MAAVNELVWFFLSLALSPNPEIPTTQIADWNVEPDPPVTENFIWPMWPYGPSTQAKGHCNRDEEWSDCEAHCQKNCSNWQQEVVVCPRICIPGCVCKEGKVRGPKGYCVRPQAECSEPNFGHNRNIVTESPVSEIWPDELEQSVTENLFRTNPPHQAVWPDELEQSVTENLSRTNPPQQAGHCTRDEFWSDCSADCQPNCSNYGEKIICPRICTPGCICKEGMIRGPKGYCIKPDECTETTDRFTWSHELETLVTESLTRTTPPNREAEGRRRCPPREHVSSCNANCQRTCDDYKERKACPQSCVKGCVCDGGLVRGKNGKCVDPNTCQGNNRQRILSSSGGCPDAAQCTAYCNRQGHRYGLCQLFLDAVCICYK